MSEPIGAMISPVGPIDPATMTVRPEASAISRQRCAVLAPAQQAGDESTVALVSDRMRVHEKTAWMLRAMRQAA